MAPPKGWRPVKAGQGRIKGSKNKVTRTAREMFVAAAEGLGGLDALKAWGQKNPTVFWTLYARLIPIDHAGEGGGPIKTTTTHIIKE